MRLELIRLSGKNIYETLSVFSMILLTRSSSPDSIPEPSLSTNMLLTKPIWGDILITWLSFDIGVMLWRPYPL